MITNNGPIVILHINLHVHTTVIIKKGMKEIAGTNVDIKDGPTLKDHL